MSKLIVVIGATGGQGGSVARHFLTRGTFKVRGVTRNTSSESATALKDAGVEMVQADLDDEESLVRAFEGAHYIFAVTDYYQHFFKHDKFYAVQKEFEHGCNLARAAARTPSLERYMWSTLPHTSKLTAGKAIVPHFEGKGKADEYIRLNLPSLAQKTVFLIFGIFTDNLALYPSFRPVWVDAAKKWVQFYPAQENAPYSSLGDHKVNTGVFVHGLLTKPEAAGKYVKCTVEEMTIEESMVVWGRASGKGPELGSTKIVSISPQQYIAMFGKMGEETTTQWLFFEYMAKEYGGLAQPQLLIGRDLLSEEERSQLLSTEESWKRMNWSEYKN